VPTACRKRKFVASGGSTGGFAAGSDFTAHEMRYERVRLHHRLNWRLRMRRNNQAPEIVEQVGFVEVA